MLERLRSLLPKSLKESIEDETTKASSVQDLVKLAKEKGIYNFVAVQGVSRTIQGEEGKPNQREHYTYYYFVTKDGEKVEFEEIHGSSDYSNPNQYVLDDESLKNVITAYDRVGFFIHEGINARVVDGWYGNPETKIFYPSTIHPIDLYNMFTQISKKKIEPFPLARTDS